MEELRKKGLFNVIFATLVWFITFMIVNKISRISGGDYYWHVNTAVFGYGNSDGTRLGIREFYPSELLKIGYPMWHVLVRIVYRLFWIPLPYCAAIVSASVNTLVYLISETIVKKTFNVFSELICFVALLIGPIYMPWFNEDIYRGQQSPNPWHNPTNLTVKPFAVVIFFLFLALIQKSKETISNKYWIVFSSLLLLSVLAKPSFYQSFVPTICIYILVDCIKARRIKPEMMKTFMSTLPATLVVVFQFVSNFTPSTDNYDGGIGFGWLDVMSSKTPNVLVSMLLLFGFPLAYVIFNRRRIKDDRGLQFLLLYQATSWLEYAVLYEKGERFGYANFGWANILAVYILFLYTIALFYRDYVENDFSDIKERLQYNGLLVLLCLHLISGGVYISQLLLVEGKFL